MHTDHDDNDDIDADDKEEEKEECFMLLLIFKKPSSFSGWIKLFFLWLRFCLELWEKV